jgi:2-polyprenyl-6-methoxyphenol hydroxylase-like FAD-dependent oxidoreductase
MNAGSITSTSTDTSHPAPARPAIPGTGRHLGRRAVVLGGSLAGLLSARVLARHFDQVVVVERDDVTGQPGGPRKGVPQGRHTHGLLVGGSQAMERLLPGLTQDVVARGGFLVDLNARFRWWLGGLEHSRFDGGEMHGLLASRPLIEDEVHQHVTRLPNVVVLAGYDITGLVGSPAEQRIRGARVASRTPGQDDVSNLIEDGVVLGDLVVDATGRGSRAAAWLTELGYPAVEESVVDVGLTYVTRWFRGQPGVLDELDADIIGSDHRGTRGGVALRQENDVWSVTLSGSFGERPPGELAAFQEYARSLAMPGVAEIATACEPIGAARTFHFPNSRWRHWEKMSGRPERFVVLGDAFCSFNPVYGQGMSSAALQAEALAGVLDRGLDGLSGRAAKAFARVVATPWALSTGPDRRHVSQPPKPLPERLLDRYLDRLLVAAARDREVKFAFNRVLNLLATPPSLFRPRVVVRVLRPAGDR